MVDPGTFLVRLFVHNNTMLQMPIVHVALNIHVTPTNVHLIYNSLSSRTIRKFYDFVFWPFFLSKVLNTNLLGILSLCLSLDLLQRQHRRIQRTETNEQSGETSVSWNDRG